MPTKAEETGRLALRAASGEQKAFDELYAATVETAYYTATLVLTSQEDIADALQISYMKAFAHIGELEHPESFEKWLKKIVINECRNYLRDNGKHIFSTVYIGGSYDDVEGSDLTVDIAGNGELRRTLDEILSSLPEKQRVCVNLFYFEKYSVAEIAALLGISEGTVKSRLHYGRRTLERKYKRSSEGKRFYGVAVVPAVAALLAYKAGKSSAPAAVKAVTGSAVAAEAQAAGVAAVALPAAVTAGAAGSAISAGAGIGAAAVVGKVAAVATAAAVTAGGAVGIKTYVENRPEPTTAQNIYTEEYATLGEFAVTEADETVISFSVSDGSTVTVTIPVTAVRIPSTVRPTAIVEVPSETLAHSHTVPRTERTSRPTTTRKQKPTTTSAPTTTERAVTSTTVKHTEPPATVPPEEDYVVSGGVLTEYKGSGGSVTVPSKIGSSSVTSIGSGAFSGNTSLKSVSLPVGVKKIGQEAFADCTALTSVSLPSTLESIGAGAFYGCSSLVSVNIPSGVTSLGDDAFYGCSSLKTVTIPDSVTSIGDGAFDGCDGVTVKCSKDSAAYEYAVANGINVST